MKLLDSLGHEDKASGTQLIQSAGALRMKGIVPIDPKKPYETELSKMARDKYARSIFTLHALRSGMIRVPRFSVYPSVGKWKSQHLEFPRGTNDDMVDMTSQLIERWWCDDQRMNNGGGGFWSILNGRR